jgi:hypothetical protein
MDEIAAEKGYDMNVTFTDTTDKYAVFLKAAGIATGDSFNPNGTHTRAEAVVMLGKIAEEFFGAGSIQGTSPFRDVPNSHWAARYVSYAVDEIGIKGNPDGTFNPDGRLENEMTIYVIHMAFDVWNPGK